ncbi:hypothetical protein D3C87_2087940 [compost metagenome]
MLLFGITKSFFNVLKDVFPACECAGPAGGGSGVGPCHIPKFLAGFEGVSMDEFVYKSCIETIAGADRVHNLLIEECRLKSHFSVQK